MGADTGPADSVDTDSSPSTVSTLGLTDMQHMPRGDVAESLGSMSLSATSPRARDRVYGYASPYLIIKNASRHQIQV